MMLAVATMGPPEGALPPPPPPPVEELVKVLREVVEVKAVEPDSWLCLGALAMLMLCCSRATPSVDAWKTGAVLVLMRGAWAIIGYPFVRMADP